RTLRDCFVTPPVASHVHTLSLPVALPLFHFRLGGKPDQSIDLACGRTEVLEEARSVGGETTEDETAVGVHSWDTTQSRIDLAFRSEEHTSELQSRENLVCRPLLDEKNASL